MPAVIGQTCSDVPMRVGKRKTNVEIERESLSLSLPLPPSLSLSFSLSLSLSLSSNICIGLRVKEALHKIIIVYLIFLLHSISRVLISTDVWARGIDVQQVSLVINYDLPNNRELYIHR